jgi:phosphotriesterase-related protein
MVFDIIRILKNAGADLSRVVIGHIDGAGFSLPTCRSLLDAGCNVAYDNFGFEGFIEFPQESRFIEMSDSKRITDLKQLISDGYLSRIFISQDIATKERLITYGGFGYAHILRDLVPVMKIKGISDEQIRTLMVDNPKRILSFIQLKG